MKHQSNLISLNVYSIIKRLLNVFRFCIFFLGKLKSIIHLMRDHFFLLPMFYRRVCLISKMVSSKILILIFFLLKYLVGVVGIKLNVLYKYFHYKNANFPYFFHICYLNL